ncbi:MAG: hypothetical protein HUK04_08455 [Bacteroidaceae bacterium]|nr:hypothetical protein [Bacteroidaceae bacterium]
MKITEKIQSLFSKKKEEAPKRPKPERPPLPIAQSLLASVGAQVKWHKPEGELHNADVMWQGGNFILRVWDKHPYALLVFPCCFSASQLDIDLVRSVLNRVNLESIFTRIATTTDEESGEVQCHVMASIVMDDDGEVRQTTLRDALSACFLVRGDLEKYFREAKDRSDDPEVEAANNNRDRYLIEEQAWNHYDEHVRITPETTVRFTVREMLRRIFDWQDVKQVVIRKIVMDEVEWIDGTLEGKTLDYEPLDAIVSPTGEVLCKQVTLLMDVTRNDLDLINTTSVLDQREPLAVAVMMRVTHEDEMAVYVQVTVARAAAHNGDVQPLHHPEQKGDAVTFVIARDLADSKARRAEYEFVMQDARDKLKTGHANELTETQELLLANDMANSEGYHLYWGRLYVRQERYAEALLHFLTLYEALRSRFLTLTPRQKTHFYNVAYGCGLCYARLQQYEKAFFYLDACAQAENSTYYMELINCLVNSGDVRADAVLSNAMAHVQERLNETDDEDDEIDNEMLQRTARFLNERRAYLLIEQKRWDQAEELLEMLMKDEASRDFAMNEIAHMATIRNIQKLENEKK